MTRDITPELGTASKKSVIRPFIATEMFFTSGTVRLNSMTRNISFDPGTGLQEFGGIGDLGSISAVEETAETKATSIQLTLSGIPSEFISISLQEQYQGEDCIVYFGLLNESLTLLSTPTVLFKGQMDTMDLFIGQTASITILVQSRMARWEEPNVGRYTNEDQQAKFPGDKFLEFVPQMQNRELNWGIKDPK